MMSILRIKSVNSSRFVGISSSSSFISLTRLRLSAVLPMGHFSREVLSVLKNKLILTCYFFYDSK
jgi:hypothetical protein